MTILVLAEHDNTTLAATTLNAVAAARRISTWQAGKEIHVLVAGLGCRCVADAATRVAGVTRVLLADMPAYASQLPENLAPLIVELARGYSHVVAPANANGKNILPRVAALLDVDQISEIIKVIDADTFQRPIYSGRAIATVQSSASIKVITVHPASFGPVAAKGGSARVETIGASCNAGISSVISEQSPRAVRSESTATSIHTFSTNHSLRSDSVHLRRSGLPRKRNATREAI